MSKSLSCEIFEIDISTANTVMVNLWNQARPIDNGKIKVLDENWYVPNSAASTRT